MKPPAGIVDGFSKALEQMKEEKMNAKQNRRRYPRRNAQFSVKYSVKSGRYRDLVSNIGAGGIYITTRQTIEPGQKISLQFPVFAFDRKPSVMGTVVRSQDNGFAVEFDNPIEERVCPDDKHPEILGDIPSTYK